MKKLIYSNLLLIILCLSFNNISYADDFYDTDIEILNPDRGLYKVLTTYETGKNYIISDQDILNECNPVYNSCIQNKINLINIKIHIKSGNDNSYSITESDIINLNKYFEFAKNHDLKVIPRAAYIWDTASKDSEPSNINIIYQNIKTLCTDIYNRNKNEITVVQSGIFGIWGEMHSSELLNTYLNPVIKTYLDYLDCDIYLSIRRPSYYRSIFNTKEPITKSTSHSKSHESRVGFYNDGYLATITDYGTYSDWSREMELEFQDSHNKYTIFGGEVTTAEKNKPPYGADINVAINDMKKTHITYLNSEWNLDVFKYWMDSSLENQSGFQYIKNHLGYRLLLKKLIIVPSMPSSNFINIDLTIENTGFGNIINNNKVQIILENDEEIFFIDTKEDPRYWDSQSETDITFKVDMPKNLKYGMVNVYIKLPDRSENDNLSIRFANEGIYNENLHANYLGSFNYIKNNSTPDFTDINKPVYDKNPEDDSILDNSKEDENILDNDSQNNKENTATYDSSNIYLTFFLAASFIYLISHKSLI